jgi:hypothetical protein
LNVNQWSLMTLTWLAESRAAGIGVPQHRLRAIGSVPPAPDRLEVFVGDEKSA